ncbi:MAG: tRNA guanosine(34) transglycosylase Tgt [Candidatus Omnitrophota bacterium]
MFTIIKEDTVTKARLGIFKTPHGSVNTPAFFPVATQAAVKGLTTRELDEIGIEGLLVNAYHLYLRPGVDVIRNAGGLHRFMGFDKTIITDSGGYQIFSLEPFRNVTDEGVAFQSHIDGKTFFLTPESVMGVQQALGSDVAVPLDECVKYPASYEVAEKACTRTVCWAQKSKTFFDREARGQAFFAIVQGATFADLRARCLEALLSLSPQGICIGGLSVGEPEDLRYNMLSLINSQLNGTFLRYFMGYGMPRDILEAVSLGTDLFDCVVPTRLARTGTVFTWEGKLVVRNSPYIDDHRPIDNQCSCYVCKKFSRAYVRHLVNVNEMLAAQLLSYHNVFWYKMFMDRIKDAIAQDRFAEFKKEFLSRYKE